MYVFPDSDRLPHEPLRVRKAALPFLAVLAREALFALGLVLLGAPVWPLFALGLVIWGWPPHLPRLSQIGRYLWLAWTARPPPPGLAPLSRVYLSLNLLLRLAAVPLLGLAWHLDELLYGRALAKQPVRAPLVLLSAARSGSTQIGHYLESDPRLVSPSVLMALAPYLWLWRLVGRWGGGRIGPERLKQLLDDQSPEEFVERHEGHPLRTDTLEILYLLSKGKLLSMALGPAVIRSDFAPSGPAARAQPHWARDFVAFADRLGRKTLLHAGPGPDGQPRRLFIKGHFQAADEALARAWPDAHFLTVLRDPVSRLKSVLNHLHANPFCEDLGAVPWAWLAAVVPEFEAEYDLYELAWFTAASGPARTTVRFKDYQHDLKGTMTLLYQRCMGEETLPAHVPTEHVARERANYRVNRGLAELGIDEAAYRARLAAVIAFAKGGPAAG